MKLSVLFQCTDFWSEWPAILQWIQNTRNTPARKIVIPIGHHVSAWIPMANLQGWGSHAGLLILNVHTTRNVITSALYIELHDVNSPVNKPLNMVATSIADVVGLNRITQMRLNQADAGNCEMFTMAPVHHMLNNGLQYKGRNCQIIHMRVGTFPQNLRWI